MKIEKIELSYWLKKNLGFDNPIHKIMSVDS